jgi:hypothetical protein
MQRFRFEVVAPEHFPDPEGVMLRNLEEAKLEAVKLGTALIRDYPEVFARPGPWTMAILDESGRLLAEIDLRAQTRSGLRLAHDGAGPFKPDGHGPGTFGDGQLDLRQRSRKKDR